MTLYGCILTLKFFFLLLSTVNFIGIAEGAVMILPSGEAPVCHGEELQLTCKTTELYSLLRWSFIVYNDRGVPTDFTCIVSSIDASQQSSQIVINSTSFNFLRISGQGMPLITTLIINLVGNSLNEVSVGCTGMGNFEMMTARTRISIVNESHPEQLQVYSRVQFGTDNVTVTLELAANHSNHETAGVSYNVSVVPQVDLLFINSTVVQLRVTYNVEYNVSIVRTLCGRYSTTTTLKLNYANCGNPLVNITEDSLRIGGYHSPALAGTTLTLSCPPGRILTGPNTTTCMENGEWEPDPQLERVKCAAKSGLPLIRVNESEVHLDNATIDGERVMFICSNDVQHSFEQAHTAVCNPQGLNWQPNTANVYSDSKTTSTCDTLTTTLVSSATVFIITSLASLLIGFLCGRLAPGKNWRPSSLESRHNIPVCSYQSNHTSIGHVYEAVASEMIASNFSDQEQQKIKVDLRENVAYEFVQPKTSKVLSA